MNDKEQYENKGFCHMYLALQLKNGANRVMRNLMNGKINKGRNSHEYTRLRLGGMLKMRNQEVHSEHNLLIHTSSFWFP